jgi:hypothetical protein
VTRYDVDRGSSCQEVETYPGLSAHHGPGLDVRFLSDVLANALLPPAAP